VIDTGAAFSIMPWWIWKDNLAQTTFETGFPDWKTIRGIAGGKLPCRFGKTHVSLADTDGSRSAWLAIPVQLATTSNRLPLLLGVAGFLDTHELVLNRDGASHIVVPGA
jgi:hypothetical protein